MRFPLPLSAISPRWRTAAALLALALSACTSNPAEKQAEHLMRGQQYFDAKQFREAEIEFRNALQIDPKIASAHYRLGMTYLGMRDLAKAQVELQRAVELNPDLREAQLELGRFHLTVGQLDQAEQKARALLDKNADDREAVLLLATVHVQGQRTEDAEEAIQQVLRLDPKSAMAHLLRARLLAQQDKPEAEVRAEIEQAIALEPSAANYVALAGYQRTRGDEAGAEKSLRLATAADADDLAAQFLLVDVLLAQGRNDDATALLVAQSSGNSVNAVAAKKRLAELYLELRQVEQSRALIEQLVGADKGNIETRYLQARLLMADDNAPQAIVTLEQVLKEAPGHAAARYQLAQARLLQNQTDQAVAELAECLRYQPDFARARDLIARLHYRSGAWDLAIEEGEKVLLTSPRDYDVLILISDSHLARRELPEAKTTAERAIARYPDRAQGYHRLGRALGDMGQPEESRAQMEHALELDPTNGEVLADILQVMRAQGRTEGDVIGRVRAHAKAHPGDPGASLLLGQLLLTSKAGSPEEGVAVLEQAIADDQNLLVAYYLLGRAYAVQGKLGEARARLTKLVEQKPDVAPVHMLLGIIDDSEGKTSAGAEHYKRALAIDPNFAPAANNLSWYYAENEGKLDLALELAKRAKSTLPDDPYIADTMGWVLYRRGLFAAAVEHLRESADKLPDNAEVRYHLGMAYLKSGEREKARTELQTAVNIGGFSASDAARQTLADMG